MDAQSEIKEATIEAVIIRKDGTQENLGVISRYTPAKNLKTFIKNLRTTDGNRTS